MTNDDAITPSVPRVPDPLVMPFANVRHLGQVSPEVFSPRNAARSAAEIAALSAESLRAVLDAAGVAGPFLIP